MSARHEIRSIDLSVQARELGAEVEPRHGDIPVITGYAALTPLGDAITTYAKMLMQYSAVKSVEVRTVGGGLITRPGAPLDFDPSQFFDRKSVQRIPSATLMAMYVAKQAAEMAGILGEDGKLRKDFNSDRVATTVASASERASNLVDLSAGLQNGKKIRPWDGVGAMLGQQGFNISEYLGLQGWGSSSTEACATGLSSGVDAAESIRSGRNDIVVAGGIEDFGTHPEILMETFEEMGAISKKYTDKPRTASRPFDKGRDGVVFGAAGVVYVVEGLRHALERGAEIHAVVLGAEKGMDAFEATSMDSKRIARLLLRTLKIPDAAGFYPVDAIVAHATSTPKGDPIEVDALRMVFGEKALRRIPITATKSIFGHTVGAAGAINALTAILALKSGIIPPTLNLDNPEFPDLFIPTKATRKNLRTILGTAYGFGGYDAAMLFGKF